MTTTANTIFQNAENHGKRIQYMIDLRTIETQMQNVTEKCGGCAKWWTPDCPREWTNKRGQKQVPSGTSNKCGQFVLSGSAKKSLELAERKIIEIQQLIQVV